MLLIFIYILIIIPFHGCKPDDEKRKNRQVYKPNIYISPVESMPLDINISFPMGGDIVRSIPEYGTGWKINVNADGLIDSKYNYLFYESKQPDIWQKAAGWVVEESELESFFRKNMSDYGFKGQETDDFIEYWIPRLKDYKFYSVYPQTKKIIEEVIQLNFSREPDHLLRLFYLIEGHDEFSGKLTEPVISNFKREGYFVAEWGVIL